MQSAEAVVTPDAMMFSSLRCDPGFHGRPRLNEGDRAHLLTNGAASGRHS